MTHFPLFPSPGRTMNTRLPNASNDGIVNIYQKTYCLMPNRRKPQFAVHDKSIWTNNLSISKLFQIGHKLFAPYLTLSLISRGQITAFLVWIANTTLPFSTLTATVSLKRHVKHISFWPVATNALNVSKQNKHANLPYVPLNFDTIDISIYPDSSYQSFQIKYSQIGYLLIFSDRHGRTNMINLHNSQISQCSELTEESDLLALSKPLKSTVHPSVALLAFNSFRKCSQLCFILKTKPFLVRV